MSAITRLLSKHASWVQGHLSAKGNMHATNRFEALCIEQGQNVATGGDPYRLPIVWIALAETVGLTVNPYSGQITDGPRAPLPGTTIVKGEQCAPMAVTLGD